MAHTRVRRRNVSVPLLQKIRCRYYYMGKQRTRKNNKNNNKNNTVDVREENVNKSATSQQEEP